MENSNVDVEPPYVTETKVNNINMYQIFFLKEKRLFSYGNQREAKRRYKDGYKGNIIRLTHIYNLRVTTVQT